MIEKVKLEDYQTASTNGTRFRLNVYLGFGWRLKLKARRWYGSAEGHCEYGLNLKLNHESWR